MYENCLLTATVEGSQTGESGSVGGLSEGGDG